MLWMASWVHPYTVRPVVGFWENQDSWAQVMLNDHACLQNYLECIQHPYHMYTNTKCFIALICCGWAYGFGLTLWCLSRWGVEFRKIGTGQSLSNVVMSWLRLQTHLESILHPFHMYTKCFITLICCGCAYVCALTLLCLCRSGVEFRKIGLSPSPSKCCNVMVKAPNLLGVHPTSMSYIS